MKILGIDPGTARMGWGVLKKNHTRNDADLEVIDYGCLTTGPESTDAERVEMLYNNLVELIKTHKPDEIAIEELFFGNNVTSAMSVGRACGVVLLVAAQHKIPVSEYKPTQIKVAITGHGAADKSQMQQMIKLLLKLKEVPQPDDTADALAVALCHAVTENFSL